MSNVNGSSKTVFVAVGRVCHMTTLSPCLISLPRNSVSVEWRCGGSGYTGVAQRRISSIAPVEHRVEVVATSSLYCSGFSISAHMPHAVVLRVVSLPATVSSSMNMSNSISESRSPSISALMQLGDDVVARIGLALLGQAR